MYDKKYMLRMYPTLYYSKMHSVVNVKYLFYNKKTLVKVLFLATMTYHDIVTTLCKSSNVSISLALKDFLIKSLFE